ncbi:MAG: chromate efflux transporter [Solirubrobacteraceae bacterium]
MTKSPEGGAGAHPGGTLVPLERIARAWGQIGLTGFGGPPAHIALLRGRVVEREGWMDAREFEDANAACGLLPGPASTQLAIFCAYRVGGVPGAIVGGLAFVVPAVVLILLLSLVFLARAPPLWIRGAGAGAGAAVAAVAVQAARGLLGPSFKRVRADRARRARWGAYLGASVAAAALIGPYLVLVLLAAGLLELAVQRRPGSLQSIHWGPLAALGSAAARSGALGPIAWTAFKVGALSFGGGFVIIPLMQGDAVHTYHWMTNAQFLNAVALGQITPGPVVATVAAVGYAAHGLLGGILAAFVAFTPSFSFILLGGSRFERLRSNANARAFLDGAGPAAIGAILGAAITLALALGQAWQFGLLAAAAIALLLGRRGVVETLLGAAAIGVLAALAGAPL